MTVSDYSEKMLSESLEKIIFQEHDLGEIKETLSNLMLGTIEPKRFKEMIVELRFKLLEELLKFFPFYIEFCKNQKDLNKFTSQTAVLGLKERDALLTEVATRLNTIHTRLKENTGGIEHNNLSNGLYFVIDGSNVAREIKNKDNKGQLLHIQLLVNKLESLGAQSCVILCDRSLRYEIDYKDEYEEYVKKNEIIETPAGTQADIFILKYAKNHDAYIISNDRFKDHYDTFGKSWITQKHISFTIVGDEIYFDKEIQNNSNKIV